MTPAEERLSHALSLRLSETQYRHLLVQAGLRDIPLSEAAREALERDIDRQRDLVGDVEMKYRTLLAGVDVEAALEQLREQGLAS